MDPTFIQWLVGQSGMAGLAAFALWLNNRQAQEALRREHETSEQLRALNAEVLTTLKDVTKALTGLQGAIDGITRPERRAPTGNQR